MVMEQYERWSNEQYKLKQNAQKEKVRGENLLKRNAVCKVISFSLKCKTNKVYTIVVPQEFGPYDPGGARTEGGHRPKTCVPYNLEKEQP